MIFDNNAKQVFAASDQIAEIHGKEQEIEILRQAKQNRSSQEKDAVGFRQALLALFPSATIYNYFDTTKAAQATEFRTEWQKEQYNNKKDCLHPVLKELYERNFEKPTFDLGLLPPYSFVVQFTFTLAQPYISRDEQDFYIIDNPIRTDKVLGLPYVAPTSWKGSLRAAFRSKVADAGQEKRIFGNAKGVENELQGGRLNFFPTFFTRKSLEIINPHDRTRRVGKNPILIESVPIGATGIFTLLYVQFDFAETNAGQAVKDLESLAKALEAMFCIYGFGAKTSSGFGLAETFLKEAKLTLRAEGLNGQETKATNDTKVSSPNLPRYLEAPERLKPEYCNADGTFKERTDNELKNLNKADRQLYDKAKSWWDKTGKELAQKAKPEPIALPISQPKSWSHWSFANFDELKNQIEALKAQVQ